MITIILFAIYNGLFISWEQNTVGKRKKWNTYWHFLGTVIRIMIFIEGIFLMPIYWELGTVLLGWTVLNLSFTVWNFTINLTRKLCGCDISIWHTGNGIIERTIKKYIPIWMIWVLGLVSIGLNVQGIIEKIL